MCRSSVTIDYKILLKLLLLCGSYTHSTSNPQNLYYKYYVIYFLAYKGDCDAYVSKKRNMIPKYYGYAARKLKKLAIVPSTDMQFDSDNAIKLESSLDSRQRQLTVLRKGYEESVIDITATNIRLLQDVLEDEERDIEHENADPLNEVTDQAPPSAPAPMISNDSLWDQPFLEDVSKVANDYHFGILEKNYMISKIYKINVISLRTCLFSYF